MLFHVLRMTINDSNFALAKNTPPSEAEPMRPIYNTFSYLEGVIIQGKISGSLYSRVQTRFAQTGGP